jgi:DNA-binding transcriptional LysR family regulator
MMDIDLNLRRVFETLYDERNVTRVAARLFLTQSAFSHARVRDVLGDPLFMRILQPTERELPACATLQSYTGPRKPDVD